MSPRRTLRLSLSTQVLLGLVLGIGVGMLCGEYVAFLHHVGHAFMLLLQMTVLPYLALSLITGLGRLTYPEVRALALKVGAVLVGAWGVACAAILVMPLAFPTWESASFFSTSLIAPPRRSTSSPSSFRPIRSTRLPIIWCRRWWCLAWPWAWPSWGWGRKRGS